MKVRNNLTLDLSQFNASRCRTGHDGGRHRQCTSRHRSLDRLLQRRLSPLSTRKAIFAFSAALVFRLVFCLIICSVYHDEAAFAPIKPLVPNPSLLTGTGSG